jgi:hypothetical protein
LMKTLNMKKMKRKKMLMTSLDYFCLNNWAL